MTRCLPRPSIYSKKKKRRQSPVVPSSSVASRVSSRAAFTGHLIPSRSPYHSNRGVSHMARRLSPLAQFNKLTRLEEFLRLIAVTDPQRWYRSPPYFLLAHMQEITQNINKIVVLAHPLPKVSVSLLWWTERSLKLMGKWPRWMVKLMWTGQKWKRGIVQPFVRKNISPKWTQRHGYYLLFSSYWYFPSRLKLAESFLCKIC